MFVKWVWSCRLGDFEMALRLIPISLLVLTGRVRLGKHIFYSDYYVSSYVDDFRLSFFKFILFGC